MYTSFSYSSRMAALELPHPQALSNPVRVHKTLTVPKLSTVLFLRPSPQATYFSVLLGQVLPTHLPHP